MVNCVRQSDFTADGKQFFFNPTIRHQINGNYEWNCCICPGRKTSAQKHSHLFFWGGIGRKVYFLYLWELRRMWSYRSHGNFWGVQGLEVCTQKLYRGAFYHSRRIEKFYILVLKILSTGYPIRVCSGQPIMNLFLASQSRLTNSLELVRSE